MSLNEKWMRTLSPSGRGCNAFPPPTESFFGGFNFLFHDEGVSRTRGPGNNLGTGTLANMNARFLSVSFLLRRPESETEIVVRNPEWIPVQRFPRSAHEERKCETSSVGFHK